MSPDGVHGNEMDGPHDFDDADAEALIRGAGADIDRRVAETLGEMRAAYVSTPPVVGATLAALIGAGPPVAPRAAGKFERARSSLLAKVGAAAAAVVAATGGLAVAGALPAPVQDAVSHLGVGSPAHGSGDKDVKHGDTNGDDRTPTSHGKGSTTSVARSVTSTTTHKDNHGGDVSGVAHDPTLEGCAHGQAVAAVASDGKSQGKSCPTTTTVAPGNGQTGATTTTTTADHGGHGTGNGSNNGKGSSGGAHAQGKGHS